MATTSSTIRVRGDARQIGPRAPGVLLFALAAQFMTMLMLAASIAPGYDVRGGAISDLGVITETALLFNLSLLAVGALDVLGGYLSIGSTVIPGSWGLPAGRPRSDRSRSGSARQGRSPQRVRTGRLHLLQHGSHG